MESIGRHFYSYLKSKKQLTDEEKQQIRGYEKNRSSLTKEQLEKIIKYNEKIINYKTGEKRKIDKNEMWNKFIFTFKKLNGEDFQQNEEIIKNIKPVFFYFLKDEEAFLKCENLTRASNPSLNKGLLIIGGNGNGKTTTLSVFKEILCRTESSFSFFNCNDVVSHYEFCRDANDKKTFYDFKIKGRSLFDDLKSEGIASNFGKSNIMKEILELRYFKKSLTHIICNYAEGSDNIEDALYEIGEKYGGRVYDRLFQMFNIIEFKGKSFR